MASPAPETYQALGRAEATAVGVNGVAKGGSQPARWASVLWGWLKPFLQGGRLLPLCFTARKTSLVLHTIANPLMPTLVFQGFEPWFSLLEVPFPTLYPNTCTLTWKP